MPGLRVQIVTFNDNEAAAVDEFLDDLLAAPTRWSRAGQNGALRIAGGHEHRIQHSPLLAQGNVVAATKLAALFRDSRGQPDYVIFYGCAGSPESSDVGQVFLVKHATYASLGTVEYVPGSSAEQVRLKPKWLAHTQPKEVDPLPAVSFLLVAGGGVVDLAKATSIDPAAVCATDKVVQVAPGTAPTAVLPPPPHAVYSKKPDWTYAETLAYARSQLGAMPMLIEMESYGIGSLTRALDIEDRVVILRVVTDDLVTKTSTSAHQKTLLSSGKVALAHLIEQVILIHGGGKAP